MSFCLVFIVEHAVAVALELRVCDLLAELLADALVFLRSLQPAGAEASGAGQTLFDGGDHLFIFV